MTGRQDGDGQRGGWLGKGGGSLSTSVSVCSVRAHAGTQTHAHGSQRANLQDAGLQEPLWGLDLPESPEGQQAPASATDLRGHGPAGEGGRGRAGRPTKLAKRHVSGGFT